MLVIQLGRQAQFSDHVGSASMASVLRSADGDRLGHRSRHRRGERGRCDFGHFGSGRRLIGGDCRRLGRQQG